MHKTFVIRMIRLKTDCHVQDESFSFYEAVDF